MCLMRYLFFSKQSVVLVVYFYLELLITMAAVPQAAFIVNKVRQNEKNRDLPLPPENATKYNSKFMNSIWGMYNRYSVHNLKNNYDSTDNSQNFRHSSGQNTKEKSSSFSFGLPKYL